jgi:hypothetical protein
MTNDFLVTRWRVRCGAAWLGLALLLLGGCSNEDRLSPSPEVPITTTSPDDSAGTGDSLPAPTDSTVVVPDTTVVTDTTVVIDSTMVVDSSSPSTLNALIPPGIVFGTIQLTPTLMNSVQNGTLMGGQISPTNAISILSAIRAKGGRIVIKMCMGADSFVKNADGTFSFTKWKALVDRFRTVNLGPYISDGTIVGHYLIDEPHRPVRWGGKVISQSTLEAMAQYSKQIWPTMTTFVRVAPSWLAASSVTYNYLDAGWLQYESWMGSISSKLTTEVAAANLKGLGLGVGLNVMNGGNGSSRIPGLTQGKYAMSASEIRTYGTALLNQSISCAFYNWVYNATYYGRSDIKSAMADMSAKAKLHARTSCRR